MNDMCEPNGYGIVNTETGSLYVIWKLFIALWLIASLVSFVSSSAACGASVKGNCCFIGGIVLILFLWIVKSRISKKVKAYQRWCALLQDIEMRRRTNQRDAIKDANSKIKEVREDEDRRIKHEAARKFAAIVNANQALPTVSGSYTCKRGEDVVCFERFVTFCEQRSEEGLKYWKDIDKGDLQITNKRIMFVGNVVNREIRVSEISAVSSYLDGFSVSMCGKVRPFLFKCGNGLLTGTALKTLISYPRIPLIPSSRVVIPKLPLEVKSDVLDEFLGSLVTASEGVAMALQKLSEDRMAKAAVLRLKILKTVKDWDRIVMLDKAIGVVAVVDLFRCYIRLGHCTEDLSSREGLCLLVALSKIFKCNRTVGNDEWKDNNFRKIIEKEFEPYVERINEIIPIYGGRTNLLLCDLLIAGGEHLKSRRIATAFYEWAKAVAGADGNISTGEGQWLGVLRAYARGEDEHTLRLAYKNQERF